MKNDVRGTGQIYFNKWDTTTQTDSKLKTNGLAHFFLSFLINRTEKLTRRSPVCNLKSENSGSFENGCLRLSNVRRKREGDHKVN